MYESRWACERTSGGTPQKALQAPDGGLFCDSQAIAAMRTGAGVITDWSMGDRTAHQLLKTAIVWCGDTQTALLPPNMTGPTELACSTEGPGAPRAFYANKELGR